MQKSDKMLGKSRILSLLPSSSKKFNDTCALIQYIYFSAMFLLVLLVYCSLAVVNVVIGVKIFYLETKPPSFLKVSVVAKLTTLI